MQTINNWNSSGANIKHFEFFYDLQIRLNVSTRFVFMNSTPGLGVFASVTLECIKLRLLCEWKYIAAIKLAQLDSSLNLMIILQVH